MRFPRIMALLQDRRGVTAVEYGLIGLVVLVAVAAAVGSLGTTALHLWQTGANALR